MRRESGDIYMISELSTCGESPRVADCCPLPRPPNGPAPSNRFSPSILTTKSTEPRKLRKDFK